MQLVWSCNEPLSGLFQHYVSQLPGSLEELANPQNRFVEVDLASVNKNTNYCNHTLTYQWLPANAMFHYLINYFLMIT